MKVVIISDTHMLHDRLDMPEGDLLLHCGDMTNVGKIQDFVIVNQWFGTLNYPKGIVCVPGNHDFAAESDPGLVKSIMTNATMLLDEMVEIAGLKIWGSPQSLAFGAWAFQLEENNAQRHWDQIPDEVDIIMTHGPAYGIMDAVPRGKSHWESVGDKHLAKRVKQIQPKIHAVGHIHESCGVLYGKTTYVNAAMWDHNHMAVRTPWVIEI